MSTINDGGPAFPSDKACDSFQCRKPSSGMSIRDYFAAHATELDLQPHLLNGYSRAQSRYRFADSMLQAKENEPTY